MLLDTFAVVPDQETMQDVMDKAAAGCVEEQKIRSGILRWVQSYRQGKADCICCSGAIVDEMDVGAYLICFSEHSAHGLAYAFCYDCASEHDEVDSFVEAGIRGMRKQGMVVTPLVAAGHG